MPLYCGECRKFTPDEAFPNFIGKCSVKNTTLSYFAQCDIDGWRPKQDLNHRNYKKYPDNCRCNLIKCISNVFQIFTP